MKLKPFVATTLLMAATLGSYSALAAEQKEHELFANINLASNYIFRGVTQTDDQAAIQGGIDYQYKGGLYAGTWVSNVDFGGPQGRGYEQDWYVGYSFKTEPVIWDVGYKLYTYPSLDDLNFGELYADIKWTFLTGGLAFTTSADDGPNSVSDSGDFYIYITGDWTVKGLGLGGTLGHYSRDRAGVPNYNHVQLYLSKDDFKFALDKNDLDVGNLDDVRFWVSWGKDFDLL
ncbi:MAG: hypothetical protein HKM94_08250 [Halobacteria archaeon]|nr:hypothetical protein [Halobacteria archaeon]